MSRTLSSRLCSESSSNPACSCHMTSRLSPNERIQRAIDILQEGRLSLLTALIKVLDPSFSAYHGGFYACTKDRPTGKLANLLDKIWSNSQGRSQILAWMELQMLSLVMQRVSDEMDGVKNSLQGKISSITRNALINWDMTSITEAIAQHAPLLTGGSFTVEHRLIVQRE